MQSSGLSFVLWEVFQKDSKEKLVSLISSRNYVIMVIMFFAVSVINNYSLNFNIAMPLHMIFRSVTVAFYHFFLFSHNLDRPL